MSSIFGENIKCSLFGESHGDLVGITIHGLAAGIKLNLELIEKRLNQRKPTTNLSTSRQEKDEFKIVSGFFNGHTTGAPLTLIIENKQHQSKDYEKTKDYLRPSHADYVAFKKYEGYQDYRGGGHFSGRLTAPIVALGAICEQILESKGIIIGSAIKSIYNNIGKSFDEVHDNKEELIKLRESNLPVIEEEMAEIIKETILSAKKEGDSVGGTIISKIIGVSAGYGEPFFKKIESVLGTLILSIPGIKGIIFGNEHITNMTGKSANDELYIKEGQIKTMTNHNGGVNGGITNGMPIILKTFIKPTSSISLEQNTVNYQTKENVKYKLEGRHDPCIVHRAVYVQNALIAFGILDIILDEEGKKWMK